MSRDTTTILTVDERIHRLERQCSRQRLGLIGLPLAALLLGAAAADVADWKGKSVTAERLTLVDSNGRARATLQVGNDGPAFRLLNDDQSPLVTIGKSRNRIGAINFYDERGNFATQEGGRKPEAE